MKLTIESASAALWIFDSGRNGIYLVVCKYTLFDALRRYKARYRQRQSL